MRAEGQEGRRNVQQRTAGEGGNIEKKNGGERGQRHQTNRQI